MAVLNVAGYLIEERCRWPVIVLLPHGDNIPNQFGISKERHIQMRKPYQLPAQHLVNDYKTGHKTISKHRITFDEHYKMANTAVTNARMFPRHFTWREKIGNDFRGNKLKITRQFKVYYDLN